MTASVITTMLRELTAVRDATDAVNARLSGEIGRQDATRAAVAALEAEGAAAEEWRARSEERAAATLAALEALAAQVEALRAGVAAERARVDEESQALVAAMARRTAVDPPVPLPAPVAPMRATLVASGAPRR